MKSIRRLTTPEQVFLFDIDPDDIAKLLITYKQNGVAVISKDEDDVTFGTTEIVDDCGVIYKATFKLTQAETKSLTSATTAEVQLRILTTDGDAVASEIWTVEVADVLNDTVLSTS